MKDLANYLPGIPPLYGVKHPSPSFGQGCDIVVEFELFYNDEPLTDITDWSMAVTVKKNLRSVYPLWEGVLGEGLKQKVTGHNIFYFHIPATDNADTVPGSYFYSVKGGKAGDAAVRNILHEGMFEVRLDASSPTPRAYPGPENTEPELL